MAKATRHLTISNDVVHVYPVFDDFDEPQNFFEGQVVRGFSLFGFWGDAGWLLDDSYVVTVDWGDGSPATQVAFSRREYETDFHRLDEALAHVYLDGDPTDTLYDPCIVTITMTDDDGGSATTFVPIWLHNAPPTGRLEHGLRSRPGETCLVSVLAIHDPGAGDTHEFAIDWNQDGDVNDEGEDWSTASTRAWSYESVGHRAFTAYIRDDNGAVTALPTGIHLSWLDLDGKDAWPDADWADELIEDELGILVRPVVEEPSEYPTRTRRPVTTASAVARADCYWCGHAHGTLGPPPTED